jgi:uncharacterized glyoxalase superfamily protein PhnB/AraC-like DNA-binding protein
LQGAAARLHHLEAWLLSRLHRAPQHAADAPIAWALQAFEGSAPRSVAEVRGALGWSPKRFIAEFSQRVGLTPKRYLRIARFQRIVQIAARGRTFGEPIDWAALALAEGHADQAHLVREFRSFSGLTPTAYHPLAPDQASHTAEKIFKTWARRTPTLRPDDSKELVMIHEVFTYLRVRDTAAAIAFYTQAFGAKELFRLTEPSGRIGHAEMELGPSVLMLSDAFPEYGIEAPPVGGSTSYASVHLHVDNADAVLEQAVAAGATVLMAPTDQFYGERSGKLRDPFGHEWLIGHSIEQLTPDEMQRRYTALMTEPSAQ